MDPESGLAASILLAGHRVARVLEARLDANVSSGEAVLLGVLRDESLTMSGVMQALHIKASTATSLVSRLETAGLVSRSRNPADRRSFLVTITPAGEAQWARAEPVFAEFDMALSKASGAQAVKGFRAVLLALPTAD